MAFDRAAAKAAGYSDEEIDAYIRANPEVVKELPPGPASANEPPAPTTQIPTIDHTASTVATVAGGAGDLLHGVAGLTKDVAGPAATAYGAYKLGQVANAAINRMGAVPPSAPVYGSPAAPIGGPVAPTAGAAPVTQAAGLGAGESTAGRTAAQVAGRAAPGVGAMALPLAAFSAPYLMAAREMAKIRENPNAPGLENNPYAMVQRGEAPTVGAAGARNARQAVANMQTGYTLSPVEAKNLLASGDQRLIALFGGVKKLQGMANPNAVNSGYAQELQQLGR